MKDVEPMDRETYDTSEITETLNFIHPHGSTFEVCSIGTKKRKLDLWDGKYAGGNKPIVAGWFEDNDVAAKIIAELDGRAEPEGIYVTLNPCNPALVARANNRLKPGVSRTKDIEIERLQNLLIDVDPRRPVGVSTTDKEKDAAISIIRLIWRDLNSLDWPEPLAAESGNGGHLIYKIDLPNTAENVEQLKYVLAALDQKYSTDAIEIDTKVFNPARISKVYGTTVRKGDSTPDRPHRKAKILYVPIVPEPVTVDLLKTLAAKGKNERSVQSAASGQSSYDRLDVPSYLARYRIEIIKYRRHGNSTLYILKQCLFNPNHQVGESAIGQTTDGILFYHCFHHSCRAKTWHDARSVISGDDCLFERQESTRRPVAIEFTDTDDHERDEWEWARKLFPRITYPWHVLPVEIAESLQQLARSHATSPVALPGAAIAIFSSLLGAAVCVAPKHSWHEPLIFWFCDIRPSGSGKTPAARALCSVLYDAQTKTDLKYKEHLKEWQSLKPKDRGPAPTRARSYFVTDLTLEGLRSEISDHGGTVVVLDELSAFLSSQNQYKSKGNDREGWLCLWDGKPIRVVRAGESFTISGARVNLFGGIQPKVWHVIFGSDKGFYLQDGTVYRFLPTYEADQMYTLNSESWDDENREVWERTLILAKEWSDEFTKDSNREAKKLCLNQDAQEYFFNWRNQMNECKADLPDQLRGFIPKITSYALRLSGVLYCMKQFASGKFPETILIRDDLVKGTDTAMFYLGHIIDATRALFNQSDFLPVEMKDQIKHLARILESLRNEVDSGRLAVGHVQQQYNSKLPLEQKVKTPRAMGTLLRKCGLTIPPQRFRIKDKGGLSCLIWDAKTENFLKRQQHCQHSKQRTAAADLAILQKDNQRQHSQIDGDNGAKEEPASTRAEPCQSKVVANVDIGDIDLSENEKWETGTI